jgi:exonuclease SbcC
MILKKVVLDNIRSYIHTEVEFSVGSTLLAGDIGCGKTSILLAIEFALFGLQPGQRGSYLLRNGADEGGVKLEFLVDGKEIIVERTLKKGKTISQDYSAITIDGEKQELAVTELKNRVLELLNYPKEFAKKQNLLYKFTVYTPQEEMKQIILEDPETRVNTLRHVFGIDKYKKIMENVALVRLKLREEKRMMEGITINLEEDKLLIEKKQKDVENMKSNLVILTGELLIESEKKREKEKAIKEVQEKIDEKRKLSEELGKSKIMLMSKKENLSTNERTLEELAHEINEFEALQFNPLKFREIEEEIIKIKKEKEKLSVVSLDLNSKITALKIKIEDSSKLKNKMSNLDVCPTCLQNVDAVYRANVLNKTHNDINSLSNQVQALEIEQISAAEKLKKIELDLDLKQRELTELKILKMKYDGIKDKREKYRKSNSLIQDLRKDITLLNDHNLSLNNSIMSLSKFDRLFEDKQTELMNAQRQERLAEIKLAELKKEIEFFSKLILELKDKVKKVEEIKKKLTHISELENWLGTKFIPVVSFIENNVMKKLKSEFSRLFSEWFAILVPESFNVRLSDNFTPVIEQQDYEIDYAYLSGGERTAIALAYRLALTQVINSLMSKLKTRDLVILDEPTDGFSEQQLDKMREVLDQLKVKQLIIVSHEQKIEGFVENVIRFKKQHGESYRVQ